MEIVAEDPWHMEGGKETREDLVVGEKEEAKEDVVGKEED